MHGHIGSLFFFILVADYDIFQFKALQYVHDYTTHRVNIKISLPVTFVDILATRADFCTRFHTTVKQENTVHFNAKFC